MGGICKVAKEAGLVRECLYRTFIKISQKLKTYFGTELHSSYKF